MPSLKDIATALAPASIEVDTKGGKLTVRGLTAGEMAKIAQRFPEFGDFINQSREGAAEVVAAGETPNLPAIEAAMIRRIDIAKAMQMGGGAWPAVIAAAVGQIDDTETEKVAAGFEFSAQQRIVNAILGLTFPAEDKDGKRPPGGEQSPVALAAD